LAALKDIVDRILELGPTDRRVIVAISGVDAAGKSTLTALLTDELRGHGVPVLVIPCDELTRPRSVRFLEPDEGLAYYRDSYEYGELFAHVLPAMRAGATEVTLQVADWEADGWQEETLRLEPGGVVLVEGCFLLTPERAPAFDLRLWIDLPVDAAIGRALGRQRDLDNMGGPDGVRERYTNRYLPGQQLHLDLDRPRERADLLVDPALTRP
jgi:uridine kinase